MDDTISRQAAIDAAVKGADPYYKDSIVEELMNVPPAQPEPKTGHWIYVGDGYADYCKCSECGDLSDYERNFCSECGVKMKSK